MLMQHGKTSHFFGRDRATGSNAEGPNEIMEEIEKEKKYK